MTTPIEPELLVRNTIYQSHWVNLFVDKVRFPNGHVIEQHHLLSFDHEAVMVIPCDAHGRYVMVKICRYPTKRAEWEFPAGSIEPGENIIEAAKRETLEETGHTSTNHEILYTYHPMNGIADQVFHIVRCRAGDVVRPFDQDEISDVGWFGEQEIWQMIRNQKIRDGYTLTAFLLHQHL